MDLLFWSECFLYSLLDHQGMLKNLYDRHEINRLEVTQVWFLCLLVNSLVSKFIVLLNPQWLRYWKCFCLQVICSVCDTEQPVCISRFAMKNFSYIFLQYIYWFHLYSRLLKFVRTVASIWGNISVKFANSTMMM